VTTDLRQTLGRAGEELAAAHFLRLGYDILARRHRTRFGELDLIVSDRDRLVFVEVKTRRAGSGDPWDTLHSAKQDQVRRMGAAWLADTADRPFFPVIRFDAVGVTIDAQGRLVRLDHLEGAF
jgi:putative endonuclease